MTLQNLSQSLVIRPHHHQRQNKSTRGAHQARQSWIQAMVASHQEQLDGSKCVTRNGNLAGKTSCVLALPKDCMPRSSHGEADWTITDSDDNQHSDPSKGQMFLHCQDKRNMERLQTNQCLKIFRWQLLTKPGQT